MPCNVTINGTINGIHTGDILTKDDIDLGASHFLTVEGAPPFTVSNECLRFETNDTKTYLYINLNEEVVSYLKTLQDSVPLIKIEFIKTHVYDSDENLIQSITLDFKGNESKGSGSRAPFEIQMRKVEKERFKRFVCRIH